MLTLTKKYRFVNKVLDKTYRIINILQLTRWDDVLFVVIYQHRDTLEEYVFTYTKSTFNANVETISEYKVLYCVIYNNLDRSYQVSDFNKLPLVSKSKKIAHIFKDDELIDIKFVTEPVNLDEYHE